MSLSLISNARTTNTNLPQRYRHPLLKGSNGGGLMLVDLSSKYCFSKQAAPTAGDVLRNLNESGVNSTVMLDSGQALSFAGNGFDFSAITSKPEGFQVPAAVSAKIYGAGAGAALVAVVSGGAVTGFTGGGGTLYGHAAWTGTIPLVLSGGGGTGATGNATVVNGVVTGGVVTAGGTGYATAPSVAVPPGPQYFGFLLVMRLPTDADWSAQGIQQTTIVGSANAYSGANPDVLSIGMSKPGGVKSLILNRQIGATNNSINLSPDNTDAGALAMLMFYRDATGQKFKLTTAGGSKQGTFSLQVPNSRDFSAIPMQIGVCTPFTTLAGNANAVKFRQHEFYFEDLSLSGRNFETVASAEWARIISSGLFS